MWWVFIATHSSVPTAGYLLSSCHAEVPGLCPQYSSGWLKPKSPGITAVFPNPLTSPRDKYQVFDSAPRGLLRVEELEDQGQSLANVFILRLLENADDREASYMLKASSQ